MSESGRRCAESQRVGKALLEYRDNPPCNEVGGTLCGQWYVPGDVMAIIMEPETVFTTADYLTRLAHLMGVDDGAGTELKPCPFCGSDAEMDTLMIEPCWWTAEVRCKGIRENKCSALMVCGGDTEGEAVEAVTKAWNRRAQKGA